MNVLVTGAAGFIGSNVAEELLNRGSMVRGLDNFETGERENIDALRSYNNFDFHEADLREASAVREAVADVDYILHQAAIPSVERSIEEPVRITEANCLGTTNLIDAARREGVERVTVASSAAVYGRKRQLPLDESMPVNPDSPYALSKFWTEAIAEQASEYYDLETVSLRYFNVFGPNQDPTGDYAAVIPAFIKRMVAGERPVIYGDGKQTRDFIFMDDVVDANIKSLTADVSGEVYNIASGKATTIYRLVETINEILGTTLDPKYEPERPGDVRHSRADISKARRELNFNPSVDLSVGLSRIISRCSETRSTGRD